MLEEVTRALELSDDSAPNSSAEEDTLETSALSVGKILVWNGFQMFPVPSAPNFLAEGTLTDALESSIQSSQNALAIDLFLTLRV